MRDTREELLEAQLFNANRQINQLAEERDKDYADMRKFQSKYVASDHRVRELMEENQRLQSENSNLLEANRDCLDNLNAIHADYAALKVKSDVLVDALEPFSKLLQEHHERLPDSQPIYGIGDALITVGDMRKALAALKGEKL